MKNIDNIDFYDSDYDVKKDDLMWNWENVNLDRVWKWKCYGHICSSYFTIRCKYTPRYWQ
ncbi:hypothetical protein CUU63_09900 [Bacillus halotolerans]|uniref:Uncharacterized protein n=1 Tax=Bacillus halotolerans TaxID=260554 RepID=A0A9Q6A8Y1_9BACI|nr:hypothetical protein CUU63_09900 [Bacillus halotolerans]